MRMITLIKKAIQVYGWYLVGLLICFYIVQGYVRDYLLKRERLKSLQSARDPDRVSILNRERERVRELQQKRFEDIMKDSKKMKKKKKKKVEKKKNESSSSFNHLLGASSNTTGSSYRPRRRRMNRGG